MPRNYRAYQVGRLSVLGVAAALCLRAGAPPPGSVEGRRAAMEASLPTFVGLGGGASESEYDLREPRPQNVLTLPGAEGRASSGLTLPGGPVAKPALVATARRPEPDDRPPVLRRDSPKLPEEMEKDSAVFLQHRFSFWKLEDARRLLGEPFRHRASVDDDKKVDGQIYAFADPSKRYREFELDFDQQTGFLRSAFVYPWDMKWEDCRRLWGSRVTPYEASNGRKFFSYENRHLDVLVDRTGTVISFGMY